MDASAGVGKVADRRGDARGPVAVAGRVPGTVI